MNSKTKRTTSIFFLLGVVLMLLARTGEAQSLGEISRQQRAKKATRPPKEYTNDDIPAPTLSGTPAPPADPAKDAAKTDAAKPPADATTATAAAPGASSTEKKADELEKEYREKATKLRENITYEERRLDVLQRELNLTQQQYYSDPNVALREQYSRDDINKRSAEIEAQKASVDKAKQALADLEEELRKKSLPLGWAR
jgi:hypothetical protein